MVTGGKMCVKCVYMKQIMWKIVWGFICLKFWLEDIVPWKELELGLCLGWQRIIGNKDAFPYEEKHKKHQDLLISERIKFERTVLWGQIGRVFIANTYFDKTQWMAFANSSLFQCSKVLIFQSWGVCVCGWTKGGFPFLYMLKIMEL